MKNFTGGDTNGFSQITRFQYFRIAAPTQDPALHFREAG